MAIVVGIVHSSGEYNGRQYDNYNLHCLRDARPEYSNEQGQITEVVKIKASDFSKYNISLGDEIKVYYDRFGRIDEIRVLN